MAFDDIFDHIGNMGPYQIALFLLLGFPCFYCGVQGMAMIFLGPDHDHWCQVDELLSLPYETQKYVAIPMTEDGYERCLNYDIDYGNYTREELCAWDWRNFNGTAPTEECSSWVYDVTQYAKTAISEYDLVCERTFLIGLVYSSWLLALIISVLCVGIISDYFGRKPILCICLSLGILSALLCSYAQGYGVFLFLRFVIALFLTAANSCAFMLITENVGPSYRVVTGAIFWCFYAIGIMVLSGIAYFVTDFRNLQIIMACIMLPTLSFVFIIPESPRWYVANDRTDEAIEVLTFMANVNKKTLPNDCEQILTSDEIIANSDKKQDIDKKGKWTILFQNKTMIKTFFITIPAWIASSFVYFGLSYNIGAFSGSLYINTFISGSVEIPANILALILMHYFGRRKTQVLSLVTGGAFCILCIPFTDSENGGLVTALAMIGKVFITSSYTTIYLFTAEMFPTDVRHIAHSICNTIGNFAGMLTPYMGAPLLAIWTPLPFLIFGLLGILTGPLLLWLPETNGVDLPDTLEDAEALWRKKNNRITTSEKDSETSRL